MVIKSARDNKVGWNAGGKVTEVQDTTKTRFDADKQEKRREARIERGWRHKGTLGGQVLRTFEGGLRELDSREMFLLALEIGHKESASTGDAATLLETPGRKKINGTTAFKK